TRRRSRAHRRTPSVPAPGSPAVRSRSPSFDDGPALQQVEEVAAIAALLQRLGQCAQLPVVDPAVAPGDLLGTAHAQALALLDRLHVARGFDQRFVRAGVQPGITATEPFELQAALLEVAAVEVRDLQFAARGRAQAGSEVAGASVVEVEAGHGIVRARTRRLLLEPDHLAARVELRDAVALRVAHVVTEHGRAVLLRAGPAQDLRQPVAVEDVVAQHQAARRTAEELAPDQERLRQAVGAGLRRVFDLHPPLRAVAEQLPE